MKKLLSLVLFSSFALAGTAYSQQAVQPAGKKSIIKLNLTAPLALHYVASYEYLLSKRQSLNLTLGFAPNTYVPFKGTLANAFSDDQDVVFAINTSTFRKIMVTPEYRFYLGKKDAPAGIYIGTFIRYTNMSASYRYKFTDSKGIVHRPELTTSFNGVGAGAMLGVQWLLGNNLSLDFWILGPFAGYNVGHTGGDHNQSTLTLEDLDDLHREIEDFKLPGWKQTAVVGNNRIDADFKGLFAGARTMGLNLGFRF